MTPADRRELCAILRRVFNAIEMGGADTLAFNAYRMIERIEKEIEPIVPWCPYGGLGDGVVCRETRGHVHDGTNHGKILLDNPEEPCPPPNQSRTSEQSLKPKIDGGSPYGSAPKPSSGGGTETPPDLDYEMAKDPKSYQRFPQIVDETSGAPTGTPARPVGTATIVPTTTSLPTDNPPDLDAIRKAWNRLRDAREGYLRSERRCEDVRPIGEAVAALLALDVPAVVAALMDEAKGERYVAGCERADRLDAEARVKELETRTAEDHDAICRQAQRLRELSQPGYADAVRRYEFANARAEAAEALADLAESVRHDTERKLTAMQQEREAARKDRGEARDKALEEAAARIDAQGRDFAAHRPIWNVVTDLAAAIRAMKGKK